MIDAFDPIRLPPRLVLIEWLLSTGMALLIAHAASPRLIRFLNIHRVRSRFVIVGINDVGLELAHRMQQGTSMGRFCGYFDFRNSDRLPGGARHLLRGHCSEIANYVRSHGISAVYIALPISSTPRIGDLLEALRDTTASIYFLPDIFAFDTVQPRYVEINGMPALSVCDTPLQGMNAVRKRICDLLLATLALAAIWPVMLAIALAVRLSSPGPILFRQKRYGLNGEEIQIYKFRSMTVCEDGSNVTQATRNDRRVTALGRFLRRTSLDELPQILNVLEGKMSFVGPRPHAIAHNEQYRKVISGYMIRHKVRPGITGWAQVSGFRGETDTIDKMRQRVHCDLEYLRNWSMWLDVRIIAQTLLIVIRGDNAY